MPIYNVFTSKICTKMYKQNSVYIYTLNKGYKNLANLNTYLHWSGVKNN